MKLTIEDLQISYPTATAQGYAVEYGNHQIGTIWETLDGHYTAEIFPPYCCSRYLEEPIPESEIDPNVDYIFGRTRIVLFRGIQAAAIAARNAYLAHQLTYPEYRELVKEAFCMDDDALDAVFETLPQSCQEYWEANRTQAGADQIIAQLKQHFTHCDRMIAAH